MPALILLVASDMKVLRRAENLLSEAGFLVATAATFEHATVLLTSLNPDLLVAEVRLGPFNGMHLAVRSRIDHPMLPVIITHATPDAVLETEARRHGAIFIVRPLDNPEFLPRVKEAIADHGRRRPTIRRWPRKRIAGVVVAELAEEPARLCNASYGGLKLAFGEERSLPEVFDLTIADAGLTVKVRTVWTSRSPNRTEYWCGAEVLDDAGPSETSQWRGFVDAM
jgi:DNA-binding response OmpR family regulator